MDWIAQFRDCNLGKLPELHIELANVEVKSDNAEPHPIPDATDFERAVQREQISHDR